MSELTVGQKRIANREDILTDAVAIVLRMRIAGLMPRIRPLRGSEIGKESRRGHIVPLSTVVRVFADPSSNETGLRCFQKQLVERLSAELGPVQSAETSHHSRARIIADALKVVREKEQKEPLSASQIDAASRAGQMASQSTVRNAFASPDNPETGLAIFRRQLAGFMKADRQSAEAAKQIQRAIVVTDAANYISGLPGNRTPITQDLFDASQAGILPSENEIGQLFRLGAGSSGFGHLKMRVEDELQRMRPDSGGLEIG